MTRLGHSDELEQEHRIDANNFRLGGTIAQFSRNQIRLHNDDYTSEDEMRAMPTKIPSREKPSESTRMEEDWARTP